MYLNPFLLFFTFPCQIQPWVSLSFPKAISAQRTTIYSSWVIYPCFYPSYTTFSVCLSSVGIFLFIHADLLSLLFVFLLLRTSFLELEGGDQYQPTPLLSTVISQGILPSKSLKWLKFALLKSRVVLLLFALLPLRILNSSWWSLQRRQPPTFTPPISSFTFESTRSSWSGLLVQIKAAQIIVRGLIASLHIL